MNELTDKQKRFCEEYIIDLNATQAAIRSGYSEDSARQIASENLSKPDIQEFIQALKDKRSEILQLDAQWVLKRLKEISDRCMQAEPVMRYDSESGMMIETGEYKFDSAGATKSTDLIGKHIGFFANDNEQKKANIKQVFRIGDTEIEL
jgi:phage terminase small subunit